MVRATQSPEAALDSARRLLADAEQERVLDRIWIHVDMDMCVQAPPRVATAWPLR